MARTIPDDLNDSLRPVSDITLHSSYEGYVIGIASARESTCPLSPDTQYGKLPTTFLAAGPI